MRFILDERSIVCQAFFNFLFQRTACFKKKAKEGL